LKAQLKKVEGGTNNRKNTSDALRKNSRRIGKVANFVGDIAIRPQMSRQGYRTNKSGHHAGIKCYSI
jgi:hypothetical protein